MLTAVFILVSIAVLVTFWLLILGAIYLKNQRQLKSKEATVASGSAGRNASTSLSPGFLGKGLRLALIVGSAILLWFFFEETALGKSTYLILQGHLGDKLALYLAKYIPTAFLIWLAYGVAFRKSGATSGFRINPSMLITGLVITSGILGAAYIMRPIESTPKYTFYNFPTRSQSGAQITNLMYHQTVARVTGPATNARIHGAGNAFWPCPEVVSPPGLAGKVRFEVMSGAGTYTIDYVITERSRRMLADLGSPALTTRFTLILAQTNPCSSLD